MHQSIELMAQYTTKKRLHMAYSFDMLGPDFSPSRFREPIENFFSKAPNGWPCWAFSNHDVPRHVGRWLSHSKDQDLLAKQAAAMLLSFEGSICLYQGEELGQTDTELLFEELTDPDGINFWPEHKGRDGCRTPMVWNENQSNGGFSRANKTWLPIKEAQLSRAVSAQGENSVLEFYRKMIKLRRAEEELRIGKTKFLDLPEPVLGYTRGKKFICIFNLSSKAVSIDLPMKIEPLLKQQVDFKGNQIKFKANGFVIGAHSN